MSDSSTCDVGSKVGSGFLEMLVKPVLNLYGAGGWVNSPYDKLQTKLQDINSKIQTANTVGMTNAIQNSVKVTDELFQEVQLTSQEMNSYVDYNNVIINNKVSLNSIYIAGSFCMLIIFLLFYLSTPIPIN
jgi:hypothetical protein